MRRTWVLFFAGAVGWGIGARASEPTTARAVVGPDAGALVSQLGDERPAVRDEAQRALERMGPGAREALAAAAEEPGETGARARAVLDRLQMSQAERDVRVELSPRVQTVRRGETVGPVKVRLVNTGEQPIVLVRPADTSEFQVRWDARDERGIEPGAPAIQVRSEAIDRVKVTDLVTIKPGESVEVSTGWRAASKQQLSSRFAFNRPGVYRVTLTYSFDPAEKLFYGPHPELTEAGVVAVKLTSEPVIIKVID